MIDVLGPEKRRRHYTGKRSLCSARVLNRGQSLGLLVARQHGVATSQLFLWRKQYREEVLLLWPQGEQVISCLTTLTAAMRSRLKNSSACSAKTMENELLKEAVEYGRAKVDSARATYCRGWGSSLVNRCLRIVACWCT